MKSLCIIALIIFTGCGLKSETKVYAVREPYEYRMITTSKDPIEVTDEIYRICKGNVASISQKEANISYTVIDFRCGVQQ